LRRARQRGSRCGLAREGHEAFVSMLIFRYVLLNILLLLNLSEAFYANAGKSPQA
jgi:hypothetical protein